MAHVETDEQKEIRLRTHLNIKGITLQDAIDLFLIIYKTKNKITSYYTCKRLLTNCFLRYFDKKKLVESLTEEDFLKWRNTVCKNPPCKDLQGLFNYVKKVFNLVQDYYSYKCVPAFRVQPIRKSYHDFNASQTIVLYTYEDFKKFLSFVDSDYFKALFEVMFYLGLRIGEIRGLQWRDLTSERKLYINRSATSKIGQGFTLIDPKSKYSYRSFLLPTFLYNDILKIKNKSKSDFIFYFGNKVNQSISETTIRRKLLFYAEKSNLPYLHPHGWRHSCASYLINDLKATIYEVKEWLGHEDIDTTSRVYIHCYGNFKENLSNKIEKLK